MHCTHHSEDMTTNQSVSIDDIVQFRGNLRGRVGRTRVNQRTLVTEASVWVDGEYSGEWLPTSELQLLASAWRATIVY